MRIRPAILPTFVPAAVMGQTSRTPGPRLPTDARVVMFFLAFGTRKHRKAIKETQEGAGAGAEAKHGP
jgi:hypothetical protein